MAQGDDLQHSYTVGKAMQDVIFIGGKAEGIYGYLTVN